MQLPEAAPMAVWPPLLAVAAPGDVSEPHSHHNLHAILARRGTIHVDVAGAARDVVGIVTGPDVEHAVDATGCDVLIRGGGGRGVCGRGSHEPDVQAYVRPDALGAAAP